MLNCQLEQRKQDIQAQAELAHKDLDKFTELQQKSFTHQARLDALEVDSVHCQNIIKELQNDSDYTENWIPTSIKHNIKVDMYPKGYTPIEDEDKCIRLIEIKEENSNESSNYQR